MPTYTSVNRINTRVPYIGSITNLSSADMVAFINDAEAVIEGKIAKMYTLPVSNAPLLEKIATDASIFEILKRAYTQERQNQSEWVERWGRAYKQADQVAEGALTLVDSAGAIIAQREDVIEVWSNTMDYKPTFDEDSFNKQIVDKDKINDLESERD